MLDLSSRWPSVSLTRPMMAPGLDIRVLTGFRQHLVSGNLANWCRLSGLGEGVGALELAAGPAYTARLASDRLLAVDAPAVATALGWHADGFAVTDVSAALCVIEMRGENASQIIARATSLDPRGVSPSAACAFAGISGIVYRHGDRDMVRLHVDHGLTAHVWMWLDQAVSAIGAI